MSVARIIRNDPDYNPKSDVMEFRLTYEGELLASGNRSSRASHKHEIRRVFHRQLKLLWESVAHLKDADSPDAALERSKPYVKSSPRGEPPDALDLARREKINEKRAVYLARNFSKFGFRFVPLVTQDLMLWCGIDILFLRKGSPGKVFNSGDIDNRIKTLFDALKTPDQREEVGEHYKDRGPDRGEDPFFCLLEDDGLVARVSVETDMLLEPVAGGIPSDSDARLILTVKLRPSTLLISNMGFV